MMPSTNVMKPARRKNLFTAGLTLAATATSVATGVFKATGAGDWAAVGGFPSSRRPRVPHRLCRRPASGLPRLAVDAEAVQELPSKSGTAGDAGRQLAAAGIGALAGGLGGALGLGGGFLVVPMLTSLLRMEPRRSVGTSAAVVLAVSCVACHAYASKGLASKRAACAIACAALVTARLGATLTNKVKPRTLKRLFGGWLVIVSSLIGSKAVGLLPYRAIPGAGEMAGLAPLVGLGSATGFISGLIGVGGGTVLVPALTLLFQFPQSTAQGTALLGMVPSSAVSFGTHWQQGNVDRGLVAFAVVGALAGGWLGSVVAVMLPDRTLRIAFSIILGCVGVKYLRS